MEIDDSNIKPGTCVWCRIDTPEPGGYAVSVASSDLKGFLPSTNTIEIGRVVPSTFVCMDGGRALFTFAFTMGTSARVQHSTASDKENAFSVWADAFPKHISLRRAVDLVMPPISSSSIIVKLDQNKSREIFPSLEQTKFTGCMKIYCQSSMSRAAAIFIDGRTVGCVYTRKPIPDPYPFEMGIKKMLEDVCSSNCEADLEMYELPREIVLAMSAIFLGYLDNPEEKLDAISYARKMLKHFDECKGTACFNLLDSVSDTPMALAFVWNGEFKGAYALAEQTYSADQQFLFTLLEKHSDLLLQTHILPTAMTTDAVCFGYSLSSEQFAL